MKNSKLFVFVSVVFFLATLFTSCSFFNQSASVTIEIPTNAINRLTTGREDVTTYSITAYLFKSDPSKINDIVLNSLNLADEGKYTFDNLALNADAKLSIESIPAGTYYVGLIASSNGQTLFYGQSDSVSIKAGDASEVNISLISPSYKLAYLDVSNLEYPEWITQGLTEKSFSTYIKDYKFIPIEQDANITFDSEKNIVLCAVQEPIWYPTLFVGSLELSGKYQTYESLLSNFSFTNISSDCLWRLSLTATDSIEVYCIENETDETKYTATLCANFTINSTSSGTDPSGETETTIAWPTEDFYLSDSGVIYGCSGNFAWTLSGVSGSFIRKNDDSTYSFFEYADGIIMPVLTMTQAQIETYLSSYISAISTLSILGVATTIDFSPIFDTIDSTSGTTYIAYDYYFSDSFDTEYKFPFAVPVSKSWTLNPDNAYQLHLIVNQKEEINPISGLEWKSTNEDTVAIVDSEEDSVVLSNNATYTTPGFFSCVGAGTATISTTYDNITYSIDINVEKLAE